MHREGFVAHWKHSVVSHTEQNSTTCLAFTCREECLSFFLSAFLLWSFGQTPSKSLCSCLKIPRYPPRLATTPASWSLAFWLSPSFSAKPSSCRHRTMWSQWWSQQEWPPCYTLESVGSSCSNLASGIAGLPWQTRSHIGSTRCRWWFMLKSLLLVRLRGPDSLKRLFMISPSFLGSQSLPP